MKLKYKLEKNESGYLKCPGCGNKLYHTQILLVCRNWKCGFYGKFGSPGFIHKVGSRFFAYAPDDVYYFCRIGTVEITDRHRLERIEKQEKR